MRKVIMLISLTALTALTSCSSDSEGDNPQREEPQEQAQHAVGFAVSRVEGSEAAQSRAEGQQSGQSRAQRAAMTRAEGSPAVGDGELTTELLQKTGFGVYCWYTGSDDFTPPIPQSARTGSSEPYLLLMRNQQVEYSASSSQSPWTYTPSKYWPLNTAEKLTFRAYAPYQSTVLPTDASGMPLLPVTVTDHDYHEGTQHDPLWGTGLHDGTVDDDDATTNNKRYGKLYDNYTFTMSGSLLAKDERDGTIDWYFHHAMAKLIFTCRVVENPGCEKVVISGITITPLYSQGLLDISSPKPSEGSSTSESTKPFWTGRSGDMDVSIENVESTNPAYPGYLKENPFEIDTNMAPPAETEPVELLEKGLLIIPRDFSGSDKMTVTISYSIDDETEKLTAVGEITSKEFLGNTVYTLNLRLTPATQGLEITLVQSAFTPWEEGLRGDRDLYNW